ncbi:hypothetical protein [Nostoc sp. C117]|uniref:hypothetical protein n=1 Tax=Nostoc sp. C117 TaxID=3349875 RepID=UPI00370D62AC
MVNSIELKLKLLREQKNTITANLETIGKEMSFSLSSLTKYQDLKRQSDEYFKLLEKVENEIELLESNRNLSVSPSQQHTISHNLSKINFREPKKIVNHILEKYLGEQGGTASFLLRNTSSMRGDLCVADIQYFLSSNSYGRFKYCPIDPLLRPDISDKRSLLDAIAEYFQPVESHPNDQQYARNIIDKISASLQGRSIVFFDFTNWDLILENDDQILSWFIQHFWHLLKEKQPEIYKEYSWVRFILFISISSLLPESDCHLDYCCDHQNFDGLKIIELPLKNWDEGDIDDWLQEIYGLSKSKSQGIAKKIYKLSNPGIPITVCSNLEKHLHNLLKV